jgi:hypothetical protein
MSRRHVHAPRLSVALLAASVFLLTFSLPVKAQTTSGSISGTIVDPQGGSIANATVKATNTVTQAGATVSTNNSGRLVSPSLLPSTYTLEVTLQGVKTYKQTGLIL